jgi:hypothetical protein
MNNQRQKRWMTVFTALLTAAIACAGTVQNLKIDGLPQYVCPSSTPRPTSTQPPTSRPLWPPYFASNLDGYQVGPNFSTIHVQWTGQNAGTVYISYSGSMSIYPYYWTGSRGYMAVDSIPGPTRAGTVGITIPAEVTTATINIYASGVAGSSRSYTVTRVYHTIYPSLSRRRAAYRAASPPRRVPPTPPGRRPLNACAPMTISWGMPSTPASSHPGCGCTSA